MGFMYTPPDNQHAVDDSDRPIVYLPVQWSAEDEAILVWWSNDYDTKFHVHSPGMPINQEHKWASIVFYIERALSVFKSEHMIRIKATEMGIKRESRLGVVPVLSWSSATSTSASKVEKQAQAKAKKGKERAKPNLGKLDEPEASK
jgi:hypothetical protein